MYGSLFCAKMTTQNVTFMHFSVTGVGIRELGEALFSSAPFPSHMHGHTFKWEQVWSKTGFLQITLNYYYWRS